MDTKRALRISLALLPPILAAACASEPYQVSPLAVTLPELGDGAVASAPSGPDVQSSEPRAIAVCYNSAFSEPAEVMERAQQICPGKGKIIRVEQDVFWNNCSLSKPARAIFICTPGSAKPSEFE